MRRLWSIVLLAIAGGCSVTPVVPPPEPLPQPSPPPPTPGPTDPIKPAPAPTNGAVPWSTVRTLAVGQTEAVVRTAMGTAPVTDAVQDDGTKLVRWVAAHPDGNGRYVVVQFDAGTVAGMAVLPFVEPPK